jgi:hypothetical protein
MVEEQQGASMVVAKPAKERYPHKVGLSLGQRAQVCRFLV